MRNSAWLRVRSLLRPRAQAVPAVAEPKSAPPAVDDRDPCPKERIDRLASCPICETPESSAVLSFNKLILSPTPPDTASYRYRYAVCHGCGTVSARCRPAGARYDWMLAHFEETLGRVEFGQRRAGKLALASYELGPTEREDLRTRAAHGVFVSDHAGIRRRDYLPGLMGDRLSNSIHVELLGSLLQLKAPRVLEVRSRLGSVSAGLQRLYGATACAMALFPNQRFLIEEVYGITASVGIDYEDFTIPFDGSFDLIVANHMLTHAICPRAMLATFHERLEPGGHLYLFNEPDERHFLATGKSIFNTMNPFHLQAFDGASLRRALEANGFRVKFQTAYRGSLLCLAQKGEYGDSWDRIDNGSRARRRHAYREAQEVASLLLPPFARGRLDEPWDTVLARGIAEGVVSVNRKGSIKLVKAQGRRSKSAGGE